MYEEIQLLTFFKEKTTTFDNNISTFVTENQQVGKSKITYLQLI